MNSGLRERMREERGLISAGSLVLIGLLLFVGYLLLAAFEGDSAQFGKAPIPGKAQVELPKGDVDIYYAEKVDPDAGVPLITPDDLNYSVSGPSGDNIRIDSRGDDAKSTGDGMARLIGAMKAPVEGSYTVTSESPQAAQRIEPALTFGQGPFAAIGQRFDETRDALAGPLGIVILAVLLLLFLLPRFERARRRASYKGKA
ncbi:MAG: hypothetical protein KDB46_08190 [Solirubrobacterales bacterium]|nr:hypothetical protein [Solirubrobacterales bacterium]